MEAATQVPPLHQTQKLVPFMKNTLLITNCILLSIGHCGGPLVTRLYFIHGGKRIWLSSCLITAGWPFMLIILIATFCLRHGGLGPGPGPTSTAKLFNMKPRLFLASLVIGTLTGVDDYIYAYGVAKLPVSTLALVIATQLAFTAVFSYLLVKQKFSSYSLNAVVLLSIGAGVLALHTSTDRPNGESKSEYVVGFVVTFGAAALYGLILPLIELTYQKAKQVVDYQLVMEIQIVMCLFATVFCIIGMIINNDFKAITREARSYELGETMYYVVLMCIAMIWQFFFLGAAGIIFCASSLLSGIIIAVLLPVTEVLAVIFYQEKFQAEKGVALILSLWGFVSYFYGEMKHNKKLKNSRRAEMQLSLDHNVVP